MATETPCTPNPHAKSKLSLVCDENTVYKLTSKKKRRTRRSLELREIDRNTSIAVVSDSDHDDKEMHMTSNSETVHSSSKKKRHKILSSDSEDNEMESVGLTPGFNASNRRATPLREVKKKLHIPHDEEGECKNKVISDSDSEGDGDSSFVGEIGGTSDNNCKGAAVNRRSKRNSSTCEYSGTASAKKLKEKKALEELRERRSGKGARRLRRQSSNLVGADDDIESSLHELEEDQEKQNEKEEEEDLRSDSDWSDFTVEDSSQSQELLSVSSCASEEEESGMSDFIDDDSQSENVGAMSFHKASQKECYERYIQMMVSSVLDNEFLSSLEKKEVPYFQEAKTSVEGLLETKKNAIKGKWKTFKDMLVDFRFIKIKRLRNVIKHTTCEACNLPRDISKTVLFYAENNGEKVTPSVKKYKVGRFCAERGRIYHKLHHHDSKLRQRCTQKINEVKEDNAELKSYEIVEYCNKDEEWLKDLYKDFKRLLGRANSYCEDGAKRRRMKNYCRSYQY